VDNCRAGRGRKIKAEKEGGTSRAAVSKKEVPLKKETEGCGKKGAMLKESWGSVAKIS